MAFAKEQVQHDNLQQNLLGAVHQQWGPDLQVSQFRKQKKEKSTGQIDRNIVDSTGQEKFRIQQTEIIFNLVLTHMTEA